MVVNFTGSEMYFLAIIIDSHKKFLNSKTVTYRTISTERHLYLLFPNKSLSEGGLRRTMEDAWCSKKHVTQSGRYHQIGKASCMEREKERV